MTKADIKEMDWTEFLRNDGTPYVSDYYKKAYEHKAADGRHFIRLVHADGSQRIDEYPRLEKLTLYSKSELIDLVKIHEIEGKS
jgi:hypothetical protein